MVPIIPPPVPKRAPPPNPPAALAPTVNINALVAYVAASPTGVSK